MEEKQSRHELNSIEMNIITVIHALRVVHFSVWSVTSRWL